MNDKIILAGLANNTTSLGEVFRRYVDCFKQFSNPDVFDLSDKITNSKFYVDKFPQFKGKIDHDIRYIHTTFHHYHALKSSTIPVQSLKNSKKIGYFVWESSEIHQKDADVLKSFDEIWTASQYCKNIFSQYISEKNIKIIGHPIPQYTGKIHKYQTFTILIIGNLSSNMDRKNLTANIEVAKNIQSIFPKTSIILKTTTVSSEEENLIKNITKNIKIKIIDKYYTTSETMRLISKCHAILSLHRSEGFGLTLAEAMEVNTIPIATNYSGNLEFMNNPNLLVDYSLCDVSGNYFKGQWANPSIESGTDRMQHLIKYYLDTDYLIKENRAYIRNNFSYSAISNQIKQALCI